MTPVDWSIRILALLGTWFSIPTPACHHSCLWVSGNTDEKDYNHAEFSPLLHHTTLGRFSFTRFLAKNKQGPNCVFWWKALGYWFYLLCDLLCDNLNAVVLAADVLFPDSVHLTIHLDTITSPSFSESAWLAKGLWSLDLRKLLGIHRDNTIKPLKIIFKTELVLSYSLSSTFSLDGNLDILSAYGCCLVKYSLLSPLGKRVWEYKLKYI